MLGHLTEEQCKNILTGQVLGRLACTDGLQPYMVPVTFVYDGEYIYGQSNEGRKLEIMRKNPNVCFEADILSDMANWESVIAYGKFEELVGAEADKAREILFNHVFSLMTSSTIHPHEHAVTGTTDDDNRIKYSMYRVKIEKLTGRFETT